MVIKKEAQLAQSLELLAHGNKPALEKDCRGFVSATPLLSTPSDLQNLSDVLLRRFFIYLLVFFLKKNKTRK